MKKKSKLLQELAQKYKVLYVEDDLILQSTTAEFFESYFGEVICASDGEEGLKYYSEYYKKNDTYIDIVITDIQMPRLNGVEFSRALMKLNKNQKVVVVSAYSETKYFIDLIRIGISGFMQKPLTSLQMFDVLYEVCQELDEERGRTHSIDLGDGYIWYAKEMYLEKDSLRVHLTSNEQVVVDLFVNNQGKIFQDVDIFNHLNIANFEKEFSSNAIKSLLKRLRKKIPQDLIKTHKNLGYCFNSK